MILWRYDRKILILYFKFETTPTSSLRTLGPRWWTIWAGREQLKGSGRGAALAPTTAPASWISTLGTATVTCCYHQELNCTTTPPLP